MPLKIVAATPPRITNRDSFIGRLPDTSDRFQWEIHGISRLTDKQLHAIRDGIRVIAKALR